MSQLGAHEPASVVFRNRFDYYQRYRGVAARLNPLMLLPYEQIRILMGRAHCALNRSLPNRHLNCRLVS
jgi:hypothetical protein